MALTPGARLGPYEIVAELGAGGMGAVFRARDTKLNRNVAIKILPDSFASDAERVARFTREAQTLAALNHPHIAQIHGLEESDGTRALVMELVEGEDLSRRIARGAIPLHEALPIARQIAEALGAAHERGVIHRDLKPANVRISPDEVVKVLDFGLAKLADSEARAGPGEGTESPTITSPVLMTGAGTILGTAAYMAPEQAKGRAADKRSDIWAFGCVVYEMLTGTRPFDGEDIPDTLANVLRIDPDWAKLPQDVPPGIRTLLEGCLTKDRRRRVADTSTLLFVLDHATGLGPPGTAPSPRRHRLSSAGIAALTAGAIAVAAIATTITWIAARPAPPPPARVSRLQIQPSGASALSLNRNDRDLAITPDGLQIVYVGNNGTQIFARRLDALDPVVLYTGSPRGLFVSPDGQWVGFVEAGNALRAVAVTGGPARTLATLDGLPRGATWGPDGSIIVATDVRETGLQRVTPGGSTTVLNAPDPAKGESDFLWPEFLPGGRAVLFTIRAVTGDLDAGQIAVLNLQSGKSHIVMKGGSHGHYVPGGQDSPPHAERDSGYLLYAAAGALRAVAFDATRLEARGTPVQVVTGVVTTQFGAVDAVVAGDGTLAYVSGAALMDATSPRSLVWIDRHGVETPIPAPPRAYATARLSPDGTRIAVAAFDQDRDLWVWDLAHPSLRRLTFDAAGDANPLWTSGGRELIFSSNRGAETALYVRPADGTGSAQRISDGVQRPRIPTAVTADGLRVVFTELTQTGGRDLRLLTRTATPRVERLLETPKEERNGDLSPNGRWLIYESNVTGPFEVYVRPFPNVNDGEWQVSKEGGSQPLWARSGRELFFVDRDGALTSVAANANDTTWTAGPLTKLPVRIPVAGTTRAYDVSPDGQRFLTIKQAAGSDRAAGPISLIVVQHWDDELRRLVPRK